MKNILKLAPWIWVVLTCYATPSFGAELKPMWQTSACYKLRLSVNDKFSNENSYVAKYIVKAADGRVFVAEKVATDMNSSEVFFPDDFRYEKLGVSASINCHFGLQYTWEIYVDNVLKDSGTIGFTRKKRH
jgi:hypothetical protein